MSENKATQQDTSDTAATALTVADRMNVATRPGGRTTILTPELTERICTEIQAGHYFNTACELAGVSPSTAYEWIQRGAGKHKRRGNNPLYAEFADAIKNADAHAEAYAVQEMKRVGKDDWRFWMTFLERRFPLRWGRIERFMGQMSRMTDSELDAIIARGEIGAGDSSDER